ncbi:MAG: hypothetical protein IT373_35275 [Polyangiaceae bacterium]|nr:hypothetical protein [Polyangiaceae bacterium]
MHPGSGGGKALLVALALVLGAAVAGACSSDDGDGSPAGGAGGVPSGGQGGAPAGGTGGGGTGGAGGEAPVPEQHAPCEAGSCWSASALELLCGPRSIDEDFSSGLYNVHEYSLWIAEGIGVEISLAATAGDWAPALLLRDEEGLVLHDGAVALSSAAASIEVLSTGKASGTASFRITAHAQQRLSLFVTAWGVVDGGFAEPIPTDAVYALDLAADCAPGELELVSPPNFDPGDVDGGYVVLPPAEPAGLYDTKHADCSRGIRRLIDVLYTVAWQWHERDPSRPPIHVLDLNEAWCSGVDHATHDDGTHADLVVGCATDVSCSDKAPVLELAKLFVDTGEVCGIINDNTSEVLGQVNGYFDQNHAYEPWHQTFMRNIGGHTQHFHVRVKQPDGTCN